eukprot:TRINITY_DN7368_c0_g1_i1.p1 TRINITY_DN7368_c0_g1~~TRINITY_DN7368_c0_g1_i1.p1  ORF type:complete len:214 (-),score=45.90 TRINITY_DN7368_c0_g1_i1:262-903(-)
MRRMISLEDDHERRLIESEVRVDLNEIAKLRFISPEFSSLHTQQLQHRGESATAPLQNYDDSFVEDIVMQMHHQIKSSLNLSSDLVKNIQAIPLSSWKRCKQDSPMFLICAGEWQALLSEIGSRALGDFVLERVLTSIIKKTSKEKKKTPNKVTELAAFLDALLRCSSILSVPLEDYRKKIMELNLSATPEGQQIEMEIAQRYFKLHQKEFQT